jgi:hypothetical protein
VIAEYRVTRSAADIVELRAAVRIQAHDLPIQGVHAVLTRRGFEIGSAQDVEDD